MTDEPTRNNWVAQDQIKSVIDRVERLEAERAAIGEDIKLVYGEAKANGLSPKILRKIVRLRKQDANDRAEEDELTELYLAALGMQTAFEFGGDE